MAYIVVGNNRGPRGLQGIQGRPGDISFRPTSDLPSLNVEDWIGTELVGIYRFPIGATAQTVINRPLGSDGAAFAEIKPIAGGGSLVTWTEYEGSRRTFEKVVSSTSANRTDWKRINKVTRTVLHNLSMPGSPATQDTEPTRHVRLPIKVFSTIDSWELAFKNFNDRNSANYGALDFVDVYIAKRASDGNGGYTQNFAETPTNLGTPVRYSAGETSERYLITDIHFQLEANVEYLLSYAYTTPGETPNHMGIGGSYLGTLPAGVQSMSVSNQWSPYTPLDVYLKLEASPDVPFYVYPGSSSETGLNTDYPLRDVWSWRHAEAHGAIPALIGQSGTTLDSWVGASNYIRGKFSTIARADKVIGNPGSNDLYGGNSLSVMKSRFEAFAVWVRKHLGDAFESADVFPRRTESASIKEVREEFNAWLKTLPSNTLVCHDRASVVTDANGLMRADFDSGDGTHLNTYGQHMLGASILVARDGAALKIQEIEATTPRKYNALPADATGGIVDGQKRVTWLTHDDTGGPTSYARKRLGIMEKESPRTAGGFLDESNRETEVVFDHAGKVLQRSVDAWAARATPHSMSTRSIWGHSLAAGIAGGASPWAPMLAAKLGVLVDNYGVGGASSAHVGARQGGKPALVAVEGGSIPASGPVNLFMDTDYMFGGVSGNQPVVIRGIRGIMTKVADNGEGADCTFTRTVSGQAVPVPDGTPLFTQYGDAARADVTYIWAARNDFFKSGTSPEQAVENIARMVDYLTSVHRKVLILEEPPAASETIGTVNRDEVDAYNTAIRAAFPQWWVPVMTWLRSQEAADAAGITFTAQDQTDITNGVTPASFRVDTLHLSTAGNTALTHRLFTEEINRGWI